MFSQLKKNILGLALCVLLACVAISLGSRFPIVGGAVFAILLGMACAPLLNKCRKPFDAGIKWTAKKVLQWAVILLGFGLNLKVVAKTGLESLPIIVATITTALVVAYLFYRCFLISKKTATLIGVGSSICGGSAIAATAPVVEADDQEIAQAISVIFFFNVLAALLFPSLGCMLGFDTTSGGAFGIFAGTAVNDTSSVTACASAWDSMHGLGAATLDKAVTVKLTRTLAIIPIVTTLSILYLRAQGVAGERNVSWWRLFPMFILYFLIASLITTLCDIAQVKAMLEAWHINTGACFGWLKTLAKSFIVIAMVAIGLNTNLVKLLKSGGKPLALGACCWIGITVVSLFMQYLFGLW
jgi:uncharacterized integral membrane protein (TIGR00698 family)